MTIDELRKQYALLQNENTDGATRTEIFQTLETDYQNMLSEKSETEKSLADVTAERDKYAVMNSRLWAKQNEIPEINDDNLTNNNETHEKKREIEDLFKE